LADTTTLPPSEPPDQFVTPVAIEDEMKTAYLDYAMSVIVSRALPDVRDGLKPVHRRILYSMHESGFEWNRPYRKSARVVGEVMGKYHPHGDQAIYDSMVRMAQDFSLRLPLIDGQGNFGSMDGDRAAAMRYTEARLAYSAHMMLDDIDRDTVNFRPNYDDSEQEPEVLPSRIPNLLVNGAGGIAVGMATNIPPHNLREVIKACCAYVDNPDVTAEDLLEHVKGPDFPTGALILGTGGARSGLLTGRGSVIIRGRTSIEEVRKDREAIIISEIPYQVNKSSMIEKIAEGVRDKKIEGISDIRDESDRDGVRVVIELKRDAIGEIILNQLYRYSQLQTSFGINMLGLNGGMPQLQNLQDLIKAFVDFREEVITRRIKFELEKARARARVLVGLVIAVANIDEIVALIRKAKNAGEAREQLMERAWPAGDVAPLVQLINEPGQEVVDGTYRLSEVQARAILDLRLNRLTALGRDELSDELKELGVKIAGYLEILRNRDQLMALLREELVEISEKFGTDRRTEIIESEFEREDEDLIQREDMVVTVTQTGYIKRVPLSTYRAQRRGGRGRTGMSTRDEDVVSQLFVANTHTPMLFFASDGKAYKLKVWKLPLGTPQSRGKAMVNLLPVATGETVNTVLPLPEDEETWAELHVMFATSKGTVRRNDLSDFSNVKSNGKLAMRLDDGDRLVGVAVCQEDDEVLLAAGGGKCIRFPANAVRVFKSRTSEGVRGIKLPKGDTVISMSIVNSSVADATEREAYVRYGSAQRQGRDEASQNFGLNPERASEMAANEQFILTVTVNGFGKRTSSYEYRTTGRGGQGIINIETSDRNGNVIATFPVDESDQIVLMTDAGQMIRCPVDDIRVAGRNTQGVTLFRVNDDEHVVSVARLADTEDAEEAEDTDIEENGSSPT
jgi:DNA gyrase subunit A